MNCVGSRGTDPAAPDWVSIDSLPASGTNLCRMFIPMVVADVAFLLAVASDTDPERSAAIACIADTQSVAAVRVSCNALVCWGCVPCWAAERVSADDC